MEIRSQFLKFLFEILSYINETKIYNTEISNLSKVCSSVHSILSLGSFTMNCCMIAEQRDAADQPAALLRSYLSHCFNSHLQLVFIFVLGVSQLDNTLHSLSVAGLGNYPPPLYRIQFWQVDWPIKHINNPGSKSGSSFETLGRI